MTSSVLADPLGAQRPRVSTFPESVSSTGVEAIELCRMAALNLDPWQEFVLSNSLGERADGRWSAFEVGLVVSRQNGKGSLLEARELTGLFLLPEERLLIHSAHQFDTSIEAFRRLLSLIEGCPDLERRVKRVSRSHGEEGIELKDGSRVRFRTRTKGGGRGFTGDWLGLDEAMILPQSMHGALLPTLSARPNPQVWYCGSAVDKDIHEHGLVFSRIRERGLRGDDPSLAYFEWSVDADSPDAVTDELAEDPESWAAANPGLGIRISAEHVSFERRSLDPRTFAVERLGVGDWPAGDGSDTVISMEDWLGLVDPDPPLIEALLPVCIAFDVTPDRSRTAIAVAGRRPDGAAHVEIADHKRGTGWVLDRLSEMLARYPSLALLCDASGPAGSLIAALEDRGHIVTTVNAREHAQACGRFFDAVEQKTLRHCGEPELNAAVKGAARRTLGDAWAWSRKSSGVDISPLVACTLAHWGMADGSFAGGFSWDE